MIHFNLQREDNVSTMDKTAGPNITSIQRFHCTLYCLHARLHVLCYHGNKLVNHDAQCKSYFGNVSCTNIFRTHLAVSKCFNAVHKDAVVMLEVNIVHEPKASALCNREHYHSIRVHHCIKTR